MTVPNAGQPRIVDGARVGGLPVAIYVVAAAAIAAKLLQGGGDAWDLRGGLGPQLQAFLGSLGG